MDLSDDDVDLEAELAAISGGGARHRPRKPASMPAANLDAMIAASLKDLPSDDEVSGEFLFLNVAKCLKHLVVN